MGNDLVSACLSHFAYVSKFVSTVAQGNELYSAVDTDGNTARDTMQAGLVTK